MNFPLIILGLVLILIGTLVAGVGWNWDKIKGKNKATLPKATMQAKTTGDRSPAQNIGEQYNYYVVGKKEKLIVSATAHLVLNFKPQSIDKLKPEPGNPFHGFIGIIEKGKHNQSTFFLQAKDPPLTWGNNAMTSSIWMDFNIAGKSPMIGVSTDYLNEIDGIEISLFFRHKKMEVTGGDLQITLNTIDGNELKEYKILPQKESEFLTISIDLRKQ